MSPSFKPNLASNRAIRFSGERGQNVNPTGEGVLLPHIPRPPRPIAIHASPPPSIVPKQKPSGRRYYGEA